MKSVTFSQLLAIISIGMLGCTFQANAKEYYKWVDARGVTTYSATPPPTQKQEPQLDPAKRNPNTATTQTATHPTTPPPAVNKEAKTTVAATSADVVKTTTASATNSAKPAAGEALIPVKNCNGVRCWDSKGRHYNLVAGNTYLSATGSKCQKNGNNMQCSK
ncbi:MULTISPECIES: DUF4124 domain-containing protein [unclassified Acinetobacter]|uniref:DUF4124 domain-containing protein n=1 Tax=unclassified Acinetobacter TaxID=196816 RepID=UPI002448F51C|nr:MULTISPECIES: DUF4124 domain-containing protein [unclassified Acinetobacter]MDH0031406.1 DUF4124 domain-containing protein [Acinetobacter sp. GD04021]MDH0887109.1 DUF4124 domain-containing protein [Acinetobacter sp. GD03873]MDH1083602.1 DUF4124 domain-containing protein [Acinetobacter sp. GD03983]MDH2190425.1 DUF4124 domain-containing protein [Acinetobacter sp. GD03645]MDH2204129.1 DUF4124 domain-containing protein [Acinetobacter sp. GD03647]